MKGFSKFLLIVIFSGLLYGCSGAGDYGTSLPDGYSLLRSSANMVTINKQEGEGVWGDALIPPKITELTWNNDYILAKQLGLKLNNPKDPNDTYKIPDESKVNYWILQINGDNIYGPLTDSEFVQKKKELSIPSNIILKSVSTYKK